MSIRPQQLRNARQTLGGSVRSSPKFFRGKIGSSFEGVSHPLTAASAAAAAMSTWVRSGTLRVGGTSHSPSPTGVPHRLGSSLPAAIAACCCAW